MDKKDILIVAIVAVVASLAVSAFAPQVGLGPSIDPKSYKEIYDPIKAYFDHGETKEISIAGKIYSFTVSHSPGSVGEEWNSACIRINDEPSQRCGIQPNKFHVLNNGVLLYINEIHNPVGTVEYCEEGPEGMCWYDISFLGTSRPAQ